ncbi:helix-turn-helix domain-containing protein [Salinibacter ruber]|uniref:helix-turn-helix domain-containing protein n=1 Tax=Salinibacter ruber TaxID=146919 RepID=UPI000E572A60|nr:helix-turn-helix domain-containing protein [Salinibacter ruber]
MPATMSNTTYSPQEIADRLGRHVNSIRRNLREGELKGEKFSNEWIVTEEALQEWLPAPIYREHFANDEA